MIQIRSGVFETNSSSTHSIAIPKNCSVIDGIYFRIGEFGWAFEEVDPADYFYTAIFEVSETEEEMKDRLEQLKKILNDNNVFYKFGKAESHIWHDEYSGKDYFCLDDGYIDHGSELREFVDDLLNDGDRLIRFLSGGLVFTGNDNSDSNGFISRDEEFIEDYDWRSNTWFKSKNEYYMSNCDDYEWHYKGN
jgi:hypothetical protein